MDFLDLMDGDYADGEDGDDDDYADADDCCEYDIVTKSFRSSIFGYFGDLERRLNIWFIDVTGAPNGNMCMYASMHVYAYMHVYIHV